MAISKNDTFILPCQTWIEYISQTLHTPMVFREMQVYGTIPQLSGVFAKTFNSKILLYDQIINSLFSCYNDFLLHHEHSQMFHTSSSLSKYTYIFTPIFG